MFKPLAVIGTAVVAIGAGFQIAAGVEQSGSGDRASSALKIPVALQRTWFPPISEYDTGGQPLDDERFDGLLAHLDRALASDETLADFEREAAAHLESFLRRLAVPKVTDEQMERVRSYLAELAERHPDGRSTIEQKVRKLDLYGGSMSSAPPSSSIQWLAMDAFEADAFGSDAEVESHEDEEVDRMLAALDDILSLPEVSADIESESALAWMYFTLGLRRSQITAGQTERISEYLDGLKERHPEAGGFIDRRRFILESLTPGNVAPNIVGTDTEGVEFALEDYRGRIVVVVFSGQWCSPCREEYPYQRAMLEIYDEEDVVLLGVNSDAKLETAIEAKRTEGLDYRTWWDGHGQPEAAFLAVTDGPIATAWDIKAWPSIFVLDGEGVVRYARTEGRGRLIAVVDDLVAERRRSVR